MFRRINQNIAVYIQVYKQENTQIENKSFFAKKKFTEIKIIEITTRR